MIKKDKKQSNFGTAVYIAKTHGDNISDEKIIEKELIDNGLSKSWEESEEIEEIELNDCRLIYVNNGDY
jgi:hypothetical protein